MSILLKLSYMILPKDHPYFHFKISCLAKVTNWTVFLQLASLSRSILLNYVSKHDGFQKTPPQLWTLFVDGRHGYGSVFIK